MLILTKEHTKHKSFQLSSLNSKTENRKDRKSETNRKIHK